MLKAAVSGLQHQGVAGMSFTEVLKDSGAARGAIYHHFPGGKAQLVSEAGAAYGEEVTAALGGLAGSTPREIVGGFLAQVRPVVADSATGGGCAVAALTVGAEPRLRAVAAAAFADWTEALAGRLTEAGVPAQQASALATMLLAQLQGAHVLCRASGDLEPFDRAARAMLALIDGAVPAACSG